MLPPNRAEALINQIIIQTFIRRILSTLETEYEAPAVARWERMVVEIVV